MKHKAATLEHPRASGPSSREPQLPPLPANGMRTRPVHQVKNYYSPTPKSEFRVHPRQLRSRRRRAKDKRLLFLAATIILSLLMVKLLFSFFPTFSKAFTTHQSNNLSQKVAVWPSPDQVSTPAITPVMALSLAIIGQESSADPQSLNPHSGALGLAQIMPANLSSWSQDVLGYRITRDEFMSNRELQMKIIQHKLSEYWQDAQADSGGDEAIAVLRVASYWYSGSPNRYTSTLPQSYHGKNGKLHRYPSIAEYSNSILKKYRHYRKSES